MRVKGLLPFLTILLRSAILFAEPLTSPKANPVPTPSATPASIPTPSASSILIPTPKLSPVTKMVVATEYILERTNLEDQIQPLTQLRLEKKFGTKGASSELIIAGRFFSPDLILLQSKTGKPIVTNELGNFTIPVKAKPQGDFSQFTFATVDIFGKIKKETIKIILRKPKRYLLATFGLGPTYIAYSEGSGSKTTFYNSLSLTGKLTASGYFGSSLAFWDVNSFLTLFPIVDNKNDTDVRFLGVNGKAGYHFKFSKIPYWVRPSAGWYYTTMFTTTTGGAPKFGYTSMTGPQLFVSNGLDLGSRFGISFYGKFSPILSKSFGLLSLNQREFAFGIHGSLILKENHRVSAGIDWANLTLTLKAANGTIVPISSNSLSLSFSYTIGVF